MAATIPSLFPPPAGAMGTCHGVACDCGLRAETYVASGTATAAPLADCPDCGGPMRWDPSGTRFGFRMGARGFSSTKQGMRRAHSIEASQARKAKTQWDRVEPMKVPEGVTVRNPTPGGVYDPNGPFASRKAPAIVVPMSGTKKEG